MPTPNQDETHDDWMSRCMSDPEQMDSFPDEAQRGAVCESKWTEHMKQMDSPMGKSQLTVRNAGNDVSEVMLYGIIGEDIFSDGITAKQFRDAVKSVRTKVLNLRINSVGGSVFEGAAMLTALDEFGKRGRVEIDIDGIAASAASVVAMGGKTIRTGANGLWMIHNPYGMVAGGAAEMRQMAEVMDKVKEGLVSAYARRVKAERKQISDWMDKETWFTAEEAVTHGFSDSVSAPLAVAAFAGHAALLAKLGYKHAPKLPEPDIAAWQETERRKQIAARWQS